MKKIELLHHWQERIKHTPASTCLLLLLVGDSAFIFLNFLLLTPFINDPLFSLERDGGFPEIYQYIKELFIIGFLLSLLIKTREVGFSVWALLFLYLLIDDALQIHETFGVYIATDLQLAPFLGLRGHDFGELAVSAMSAALFLPPLAFLYVRGSSAFKQVTRHLLLLLIALAIFGIFFDMLHAAVKMGKHVYFLSAVVEDGGEMVVMSFITWYAFLLNIRDGEIGSTYGKNKCV